MREAFKGKSTSVIALVGVVCVTILCVMAMWITESDAPLAVAVAAIAGLVGVAGVKTRANNGQGPPS